MATIKSITPRFYNNAPDGFEVVVTDGAREIVGTISKKDTKSDKNLQAGDNVTVVEKPWTKGTLTINFLTINRIPQNTPISSPSTPPAPPEQKSPKSDPPVSSRLALVGNTLQGLKAEACMRAMEYVINAFSNERITWEQVGEKQKECAAILCSELDGIFTDKA